MTTIDVRSIPQITAIQSAFSAILDKANLSLQGIEQQIVQKVAQFYATPTAIKQFRTRIEFIRERATARRDNDTLGRLSGIEAKVNEIQAKYERAKPTVNAAVAQLQGVQGTSSLTSSVLSSTANAGLLMAGVFTAVNSQDAAISALERGVLTPAEAAALYRKLQNPITDTKKIALIIGAAVFIVLVLRGR